MIPATLACAIACALLVLAEWRALRPLRAAAKVTASLAFVAVGFLASTEQPWFLAGLVLGLVGDIALLGDGKRAFLAGLGAFLLGHLAYVVAIAQLVPPRLWPGPLAMLPIACAVGTLAYLWPRLGTMRIPVIGYVIVIVAMMIGALAARDNALLALGAALFFASDVAVSRDKFVAKSFANKVWGLPAYYAGQLLIAWSLTG
jgi:uncharacterized membrane protein YhhN